MLIYYIGRRISISISTSPPHSRLCPMLDSNPFRTFYQSGKSCTRSLSISHPFNLLFWVVVARHSHMIQPDSKTFEIRTPPRPKLSISNNETFVTTKLCSKPFLNPPNTEYCPFNYLLLFTIYTSIYIYRFYCYWVLYALSALA